MSGALMLVALVFEIITSETWGAIILILSELEIN